MARLHILAHDYEDADLVQRVQPQLGDAAGGLASDTQESKVGSYENLLKMLHLNMRGYLSDIADTIALLRGRARSPSSFQ